MSNFLSEVKRIQEAKNQRLPGQRERAKESWNALKAAIESMSRSGFSGDGAMQTDSAGMHIHVSGGEPSEGIEKFLCIITNAGPTGQADWLDWRYWVKQVDPNPEYDPTQQWKTTNQPFITTPDGLWVTAYNLAEADVLTSGTLNNMPNATGSDANSSGTWNQGFHGLALNKAPTTGAATTHGTKTNSSNLVNFEHWIYWRPIIVWKGGAFKTTGTAPNLVTNPFYYFDTTPWRMYPHYYLQAKGLGSTGCVCDWDWHARFGEAIHTFSAHNEVRPSWMNTGCP